MKTIAFAVAMVSGQALADQYFDSHYSDHQYMPKEHFPVDYWDDFPEWRDPDDWRTDHIHPDLIDQFITELLQFMTEDEGIFYSRTISPEKLHAYLHYNYNGGGAFGPLSHHEYERMMTGEFDPGFEHYKQALEANQTAVEENHVSKYGKHYD